MFEEAAGPDLLAELTTRDVTQQHRRIAAQIRVGARLGVWGLVGGFGIMTGFTLGAPISLAAAMSAMGAGLLISGLGTLLASTGVLRATHASSSIVREAAKGGVPLGAVLSLLGLTGLTQWGPLVAIVNALAPGAAALGALVVVVLVLGFFITLPSLGGTDPGARDDGDA